MKEKLVTHLDLVRKLADRFQVHLAFFDQPAELLSLLLGIPEEHFHAEEADAEFLHSVDAVRGDANTSTFGALPTCLKDLLIDLPVELLLQVLLTVLLSSGDAQPGRRFDGERLEPGDSGATALQNVCYNLWKRFVFPHCPPGDDARRS